LQKDKLVGGKRVDIFYRKRSGVDKVGGKLGHREEAKLTVVDEGCGCAVYFDGYGEDAGFFKGGVFGLKKVEARGFELFLKGYGVAVFVQLLLDDEVWVFWEVFQVNDDVLGGGGVFPGAIFVFLGREIGGGEAEVAFGVNKADFVGFLGGEGLTGFVPGALADEVAGILGVPGDVPALAGQGGLGVFGEEGLKRGWGMAVSVGVGSVTCGVALTPVPSPTGRGGVCGRGRRRGRG
jgi:hypothetical protein